MQLCKAAETGEHLYIGLINRRYRGRYMQLCKAAEKKRAPGPRLSRDTKLLRTSCAAAMQSAARLQLAFDAGLTDLHFAQKQIFQGYIQWLTNTCIDPIAALAVARVYGVPWTADITTGAAAAAKLELLQWCVTSRCPLDAQAALVAAAKGGDVLTVEWLVQQLADLVDCSELYDDMLVSALFLALLAAAQCAHKTTLHTISNTPWYHSEAVHCSVLCIQLIF
jgi:hypothetical protein